MNNWWNGSTDQLAVCSRSALVELPAVLPATGRFVVARLDATRMTDADHALYEFSDALLFPGYFGWHWDALSDCLRDLNWLPADGYLIVVENAPQLLSSSAEDQHTLFRILSQAVRYWASPLGQPEGKGIPFKVLLLCDRDEQRRCCGKRSHTRFTRRGESSMRATPPAIRSSAHADTAEAKRGHPLSGRYAHSSGSTLTAMNSRFYRRGRDESRGDELDAWGHSVWYFEVDDDGWPVPQIEVYDTGPVLRYGPEHEEDQYGGLG